MTSLFRGKIERMIEAEREKGSERSRHKWQNGGWHRQEMKEERKRMMEGGMQDIDREDGAVEGKGENRKRVYIAAHFHTRNTVSHTRSETKQL